MAEELRLRGQISTVCAIRNTCTSTKKYPNMYKFHISGNGDGNLCESDPKLCLATFNQREPGQFRNNGNDVAGIPAAHYFYWGKVFRCMTDNRDGLRQILNSNMLRTNWFILTRFKDKPLKRFEVRINLKYTDNRRIGTILALKLVIRLVYAMIWPRRPPNTSVASPLAIRSISLYLITVLGENSKINAKLILFSLQMYKFHPYINKCSTIKLKRLQHHHCRSTTLVDIELLNDIITVYEERGSQLT